MWATAFLLSLATLHFSVHSLLFGIEAGSELEQIQSEKRLLVKVG